MNTKLVPLGGRIQVTALVAALLLVAGGGSRAADAAVLTFANVPIGGKVELIAELKPVIPTGPDEGSKATASPKIDDAKAEGKLKLSSVSCNGPPPTRMATEYWLAARSRDTTI